MIGSTGLTKLIETHPILVSCSAMLWAIWKVRNDLCFNNKTVIDPLDASVILRKEKEKRRRRRRSWQKEANGLEAWLKRSLVAILAGPLGQADLLTAGRAFIHLGVGGHSTSSASI